MLSTIKKVAPVLELFTPERPEWRMSEIASELGMPKSSAHSLLSTLADIGLLTTTSRGRYRLGWTLLTLGERMRVSLDFRTHVVPVMEELAAGVRELVLLAVLDRTQALYVARAEGSHPAARIAGVRVGARLPVHCTAVGKVLLASRDPAEVRQMLTGVQLRQLTPRSIVTLDALETVLAQVRADGVAYDFGEAASDISCIAAPVHDRHDCVVAAISVSVPGYRFERVRPRALQAVHTAARAASMALATAELHDQQDELIPTSALR